MQNNIAYLYNPASQTEQELIEGFVARHKEFNRIMRDMKQSKLDEISQNFLITAQRGMGKTTLLLRLEYEINAMPELSHLIPIRFTEEQYNIVSFCNLWEVVADALEELDGFKGIVEALENAIEEDIESCFEVIQKALQENEKKLLLLIDNFQDMLHKFTDNEVKELRDILHGTTLQLITASSIAIENTYLHDKPFFEFFKTIELEGLTTQESEELFQNLAKNHNGDSENYDASRIKIIKNLTAGVPRTMIIIFKIFLDKNAEIFENLEQILEDVTPLYKHRMDDLTAPQQRVAHEIAIAWDGITFEELKKKTRVEEDELRTHLLDLQKAYFIDVSHVGTSIDIYQLKERFFNIWYLMRNGKKNKSRVQWLVGFFESWYTQDELKKRAFEHIHSVKQGNMYPKGALYMGEALACIVKDSLLEREILLETKEYLEQSSHKLAEKLTQPSEEASAYHNMGNSYYNKGEYDKAIASYEKAIELNPKYDSAYHNMGLSYDNKGAYDKAIASYEKAIELNPKYDSAYYNMGNSYDNKGEYDKAITSYEKAIELNPKYDSAYHNMGNSYYNKGEYDKAITSYEKAIELNPKYDLAYHNMGLSYDNKGAYDKAIASYEKAIELNTKYDSAYNSMGNSYYNKGEYDKAIASYEKAIELNPKYDLAYHNMGLSYDNKGAYDKAIASYEKAIELNPKKDSVHHNMGDSYFNKREYGKSITSYEKAIALNPKDISAYNKMGHNYYNKREYDKAIASYEKAIELNPKYALAYHSMGISYDNKGEYDKAIASYEKAIELNTKYDSAYNSMGNSYYNKGEYDKAIASYEKAIELNPKYDSAYYNMGFSYHKKREYNKAIASYEKAIELNPKKDSVHHNMGDSYFNKREYGKAITSYEKAIALNPKDISAYNKMGHNYYNKREYDKAIASYEKAIELNPKYALAYHSMGISYDNKGEYDKAIAFYEKAIELNPKYAVAYNSMGISYANKGEYDKAIASYEKAIELNPKYASAYNSIAWLYYEQNMEKETSLKLSRKSVELKKDMYNLHTYATILLWNSLYEKSLETIEELLRKHDYLKILEDMTHYFLLLMAKEKHHDLDELMQKYPKLKNEFKPVYYTLMYFMQDEYPTEYKRMGSELKETVEEMIAEVKQLAEKYAEPS